MRIQQLPVADALQSLKSGPQGLSCDEVTRRLHEFGPNEMIPVRRESVLLRVLKEFTQFLSLMLWFCAGLALLAEWSTPGQGMAKLAYAIVAIILISGLFSFWQEYRADQTLAALRKLLPTHVEVVRDGTRMQASAEQLVPGDLIRLSPGDSVPADCRLIEAFGVRVNNATVTGESLPQSRDAKPSDEEMPIRSKNIVLAGTSIMSGRATAVVTATGIRTEFGKIAHLTQISGEPESPLRKEIAHLSRVIAILAIGIGSVFFVIGRMIGIAFWDAFIFAIGIIVAMVPEGLMPTLTLALVLAAKRMAKRNVLVRHLPSVETLGSATVICTDKTGTLTQNRMAVKQVILGTSAALTPEAAATGQFAQGHLPFFLTARLCNDLSDSDETTKLPMQGDPMDISLVAMAKTALPESLIWRRLSEVPFDADRMRASVVYEMPTGPMLYCKGAPETVLPLCSWALEYGETHELTANLRDKITAAQNTMAEHGLRVLAFAYRELETGYERRPLERDLVFTGLVGLEDPPRPEVPDAIRKCREAGIKVIMVTGDNPGTARAIARAIGLVRSASPVVISGEELGRLSIVELQLALDAPEILFARVSADQKLRIVDALKANKHVVAVTGDGVNDAPALKSAHIGIAMGQTSSDVAKEAADMVLLDDNFGSIVNAIEEGRAVFENIRKFLTYILSHNVPELIPYLAFVVFKIPLPLTPIQILAIDMGTDSLTALGLGVESPDPNAMRQPPRAANERLLNLPLALRAYLFLGMIEAVAAMAAFFFVLRSAGWKYGETLAGDSPLYLQATTACLTAIVAMQVVNVFLCRSSMRSAFSTGLVRNKLIGWGVLLEFVLIGLVDYTSWGNRLFATAPITTSVWLFILPFCLGLFVLEELRKRLIRGRGYSG